MHIGILLISRVFLMLYMLHMLQCDNFDLNVFLTDYGKGWIKTKRLSPDGFIQVEILKLFVDL